MSVLSWRGWKPVNLMDTVLGSQKDDNARDEGVLLFLFFFNKGPAVVLMKRLRAPALGIGLLSLNLDLVT